VRIYGMNFTGPKIAEKIFNFFTHRPGIGFGRIIYGDLFAGMGVIEAQRPGG